MIHRDIKPENLIFDSKGYLYITDFGISKRYKGAPMTFLSGTPGYMAPEILMKKGHSFSVDFYALGVILHEMIMAKRPYPGRQRREVFEFYYHKFFSENKLNLI